MYDIVIIGAGPAGLTAAVYSLRAGKTVLIIEKAGFGGQVAFSPKIENFPGTVSVSGAELAEKMVDQALALGVETAFGAVSGIRGTASPFTVETDGGSYECKAVIIAAGAKHRRLGVAREDELAGSGVSYCAVCDGAFFTGKDVGIVGGGNSALQEAVMLSDICRGVTVIQNLAFLTGEAKLRAILESKNNVRIIYSKTVDSLSGGDSLTGVTVRDSADGKLTELKLDGLFVAIGLEPENAAFAPPVKLDANGYIIAGEDCRTGVDGIYAAGDCRTKSVRQITTATADGASASVAACRYIDSIGG